MCLYPWEKQIGRSFFSHTFKVSLYLSSPSHLQTWNCKAFYSPKKFLQFHSSCMSDQTPKMKVYGGKNRWYSAILGDMWEKLRRRLSFSLASLLLVEIYISGKSLGTVLKYWSLFLEFHCFSHFGEKRESFTLRPHFNGLHFFWYPSRENIALVWREAIKNTSSLQIYLYPD